jgi:DNA-binding CsgD family transcriptional regulator
MVVSANIDPPDSAVPSVFALVGRAEMVQLVTDVAQHAASLPPALIVLGETGIGKSVLLHAAVVSAPDAGVRVLFAAGKESAARKVYGSLNQLLWPLMEYCERLPDVLRETLLDVLGETPASASAPRGPAAIRHAVLSLIEAAAESVPLLLAIDDADRFDRDSLEVIGHVVRRVTTSRVATIMTARRGQLSGVDSSVATVEVAPLTEAESAELLAAQPSPVSPGVVGEIVRFCAGNPLALIEVSRLYARTGERVFRGVNAPPLGAAHAVFAMQLAELPTDTRRLLLLTAAGSGYETIATITAAAGHDADAAAWQPALSAGLITMTGDRRPEFCHPLARAAAYAEGSLSQRRQAHLALAGVLKGEPSCRAWHLAAAATVPEEGIAQSLEAASKLSFRRGGYLEVARALQRAAELSPDQESAARRFATAGAAANFAGDTAWAISLCQNAAVATRDADMLAYATSTRASILVQSARPAEAFDVIQQRLDGQPPVSGHLRLSLAYLAANAAYYSGDPHHRLALQRWLPSLPDAAEQPPTEQLTPLPPQCSGLARAYVQIYADSATSGDAPLRDWDHGWLRPAPEPRVEPYRLLITGVLAYVTEESALAVRQLMAAMEQLKMAGGLRGFSYTVAPLAWALLDTGQWSTLAALLGDDNAAAGGHGSELVQQETAACAALMSAYRGEHTQSATILNRAGLAVTSSGFTPTAAAVLRATAAAAAAAGDFATAYQRTRALFGPDGHPAHFVVSYRAIADLAWTAARSGNLDEARPLVTKLGRLLGSSPPPRLRLLRHQAIALVSTTQVAERHHRLAVFDPAGQEWPLERARARLHYGEWLRRRRRSAEARPQLLAALDLFDGLGAEPLAATARAELRAAGVVLDTAELPDTLDELTAQERHIVMLAATGLTNRDIADRLGVSPRTVGSHLYHIYPKLGVTSRHELRRFVPDGGQND